MSTIIITPASTLTAPLANSVTNELSIDLDMSADLCDDSCTPELLTAEEVANEAAKLERDVDEVVGLDRANAERIEQLFDDCLKQTTYVVTDYLNDQPVDTTEFTSITNAVDYLVTNTSYEPNMCHPVMCHPDGSGREFCIVANDWV